MHKINSITIVSYILKIEIQAIHYKSNVCPKWYSRVEKIVITHWIIERLKEILPKLSTLFQDLFRRMTYEYRVLQTKLNEVQGCSPDPPIPMKHVL